MTSSADSKWVLRFDVALIWFLANFGAAKAGIYLVPLGIAAIATPTIYGAIEFGWAVGLLSASLLVGAQLGGVNQRYLIEQDRIVDDELALWCALGCALALLLWVSSALFGLTALAQVAVASLGVAVVHNVVSTRARMRGARVLTAWSDGTATFVAGALFLGLLLIGNASSPNALAFGYAVFAGCAGVTSAILFFLQRTPRLMERISRSWLLGLPMLANAVLATWLGVYGRILIGMLAADNVAAYGVMFRVAGLALAVHQLAVTALFARIYGARTKESERLLVPFLIAVVALLAVLSLAAPNLISYVSIAALDARGKRQFAVAFPIVAVQILFWIAFAMLQMRINRSGLAVRAFMPMLLVTLVGNGLTIAAGWLSGGNLALLCWAIALQSAALFAVEYVVLARARLPHWRLGRVALFGGLLLSAIALLHHFIHMSVQPTA